MKLISFFIFTFIASATAGVNSYGVCGFDSYYQCTAVIPYSWEEPSSAATKFDTNLYSYNLNIPFTFRPYGSVPHDTFSIESSMALISYSADQTKAWAIAAMYPAYYDGSALSSIFYELKGVAPTRKMIVTWKNMKNYGNDDITCQVKIFENGNVEFHVQTYLKTSEDTILNGIEYVDFYSYDDQWINFYIYDNLPHNFTNTASGLYVANAPTTGICGNSILEAGEECDGGLCCNSACKFLQASTVCRPSQGPCDVQEVCSGQSADCPVDGFSPATVSCPEDFGVCDVRTNRKCSGNSASCSGFSIPTLAGSQVHWLAYSVISFQDFSADTGAVGGRLAVRGNVAITGGFSVADEVTISVLNSNPTTPIVPATFSFIAGGNVAWNNGEIYPTSYSSIREEKGYVGGSFTGDSELQKRFSVVNGGNLDADFDIAQNHYVIISDNLGSETANVKVDSFWSGLHFSCNDQSKRYVANIDSKLFDTATWYSVDDASCPFGSAWIINIVGNDAMNFQGGDFPGIGERIVFNIRGSGRTVNIKNRVNGNVLAPRHTVVQDGGVSTALVIAGNIPKWSSATNPSCTDLQPFTFILKNNQVSLRGSSEINLVTFSIVHVGDNVEFNSKSYKVQERKSTNGQLSVVLDRALDEDVPEGSSLKVLVNPNQARGSDSVNVQNSSAVTLVTSAVIFIFALLF